MERTTLKYFIQSAVWEREKHVVRNGELPIRPCVTSGFRR